MPYMRRRGFGQAIQAAALSTPASPGTFGSAGSGAPLNLNPFDWGSNVECNWCQLFPLLCSSATIAACTTYANPTTFSPAPPSPTAPPAVAGALSTAPGGPYVCSDGSTATAATNCPDYVAAVNAQIAAKVAADKAQAQDFFSNLPNPTPPPSCFFGDPTLNADGTYSCTGPGGLSWTMIALIAAGVLGVVLIGGRR